MADNLKYHRMTESDVRRLICTLAAPTILTMLTTSLYNMVDTFFVGQLGTSATGAVGVAFSVMSVIQGIGFYFGHGSGTYLSQQLGKKNEQEARIGAASGFFQALAAGAALGCLGFLFARPLAQAMGATRTILPYAEEYMRYIFLGAPFMMGAFVLNNQLRYQGNAAYSMYGVISGAVLNVALDPLFIWGFRMGIGGAAAATAISQSVSFFVLLAIAARRGSVPVVPKMARFGWRYVRIIFRGGFPSFCRQMVVSAALICINHCAGAFSDAAVAALSIAQRVMAVLGALLIGYGQGFQPVCAFNYGAGRLDRVNKAFWFSVVSSSAAMLVISTATFFLAESLVRLCRSDDMEVIRIGRRALQLQALTFPTYSWVTISNMMMQATNRPLRSALLAISRQGLAFIPLALSLTAVAGLEGLLWAQPLADMITIVVAVPLSLGVLREINAGTTAPCPDA